MVIKNKYKDGKIDNSILKQASGSIHALIVINRTEDTRSSIYSFNKYLLSAFYWAETDKSLSSDTLEQSKHVNSYSFINY